MSPPSRTCRHQTLRHCDPFTKTGRRSFDTANWRLNRRDFARLAPAPGRDCCNIFGRRFLRHLVNDIVRRARDHAIRTVARQASTQAGWCSAVWAVERHSSASIGMPVYEAGETLGKLQRSVFLCDYFGRNTFRQEIQRLLSQIESIHTAARHTRGPDLAATGTNARANGRYLRRAHAAHQHRYCVECA